MNLTKLAEAFRSGKLSPATAIERSFVAAKTHENLNCFVTLNSPPASQATQNAQAKLADSDAGPLTGIPIAHKDIFCTAGIKTTCASQILADYIPPYESHVTALLKSAGAISIGKCNMDEFAMGTTGENSSFGATLNPWDQTRCAGGSSSGSAAAVAARIVPVATGTDTGGSVRLPASYCGICGIKPTYGMVSRRGIVAYASSLDQAGVLATCTADLRIMLEAMIGHDKHDSTSLPDAKLAPASFANSDKLLTIGIADEFFGAGIDPDVAQIVRNAVNVLVGDNAKSTPIEFSHLEFAVPTYYIIACAEASSNLARYDGMLYGRRITTDNLAESITSSRSEGFGKEVQRRIILGSFVLSHGYIDAYYRQAQKIRHLLIDDFNNAFASCDLIATPTSPTVAPKLGTLSNDPLLMYSQDICTVPASLAGLPALSIPCGMNDDMPVGMQLIGPARSENLLLDVAERFEQLTNHHKRIPPGFDDE